MDSDYLAERIAKTKELIEAAEDAQVGLMAGTIQSYTIDTGQSRQTVTNMNITELKNYLEALYNRLATLCARAGQGGTIQINPGF